MTNRSINAHNQSINIRQINRHFRHKQSSKRTNQKRFGEYGSCDYRANRARRRTWWPWRHKPVRSWPCDNLRAAWLRTREATARESARLKQLKTEIDGWNFGRRRARHKHTRLGNENPQKTRLPISTPRHPHALPSPADLSSNRGDQICRFSVFHRMYSGIKNVLTGISTATNIGVALE